MFSFFSEDFQLIPKKFVPKNDFCGNHQFFQHSTKHIPKAVGFFFPLPFLPGQVAQRFMDVQRCRSRDKWHQKMRTMTLRCIFPTFIGGDFNDFCMFTSIWGNDSHFDLRIIFRWVVGEKPPTRKVCVFFCLQLMIIGVVRKCLCKPYHRISHVVP